MEIYFVLCNTCWNLERYYTFTFENKLKVKQRMKATKK